MQCPCGAEIRDQQHEVRTLSKAREWTAGWGGELKESDLPVIVNQSKCPGCGRIAYSVRSKGLLVYAQG